MVCIDVCIRGTRISSIEFLSFSGFASAICKYGGHHYKCHNISNTASYRVIMFKAFYSLVDNDVQCCILILNDIHMSSILKMTSG